MNLDFNMGFFKGKKVKLTGYPSIDKLHESDATFFQKNPIIPSISIYLALKLVSIPYRKTTAVDCLDLEATYLDLYKSSKILSKGFEELGIKKGDIITVSMPNFYQAIAIFLAANKIGAVITFLNSHSEIEEVENYLNLFESPLFINFDKQNDYNEQIKKNTKVKQIITLSRKDVNKKNFSGIKNGIIGYNDFISFDDMKQISDSFKGISKINLDGKQDALILFTSGSTGNPKAVVLTNENILASGIYMKNSTNLSNTIGEKSLVCVPFCYPYGFATSTLMSLLCGREVILGPDLNASNLSYYYSKKPNIVFGSPAMLELTTRNIPKEQDLSSVHTFISGGDFLQPKKAEKGKEFFISHGAKVEMCNGSGNAETVGASTNAVGQPNRPETVGKVLYGEDVIIINKDTMQELKYGEEGTFCVSGKNVFKGYYKEPELTAEAKFTYNGKEYIKSGTRGFLDEKGYFTLTGRDSRFYIMSTLNKVYCDHVQSIISAIDIVESCAVVQVPDDEFLYVNKAFIVLNEGVIADQNTMDYIKKKCNSQLIMPETLEIVQLKPYEVPSYFEFVDRLPRLIDSEKIDYKQLEKQAKNEQNKRLIKNI